MVKVDKASYDFYTRLTNFYVQFRGVANNYNQCVRAIHTIYGDKKTLAYLYKLTAETLKMEQLIVQIVSLTKEYKQWLDKRQNE